MKHQKGSFAMQHHSQNDKTGTAGILATDVVITSDVIERHIAEGKRLQAEAVAAFLRGSFARVASVFHRNQADDTANGGAMPHRA